VATVRVSLLVMAALLLAACTSSKPAARTTTTRSSSHPTTSVATSANPPGWVPVAFGDGRVSVPANWSVLYGQPPCVVGHAPGELFVNPLSGVYHCPEDTAPGPSTIVDLEALSPTAKAGARALTINGITVREALSGTAIANTYLVRSLGLQVTVNGPQARSVLYTLARSPRAVVLGTGPAPRTPSSWRRLSFAGVRADVPGTWPVTRTDVYGSNCSPEQAIEFLGAASAVLDTDRKLLLPPCPYFPTPQPPQVASLGLRIDRTTVYPPLIHAHFGTCLHLHGLNACPVTSDAYSILVLKVTVPGRRRSVMVSIGLAGNGMVARTILHSLRAA